MSKGGRQANWYCRSRPKRLMGAVAPVAPTPAAPATITGSTGLDDREASRCGRRSGALKEIAHETR
jgi:hypothetical protein